MGDPFGQILLAPILAGVFLLLSWSYGRSIRGKRPFTAFMKGVMLYGSLFVLGMIYLMAWAPELGAPLGIPGRYVWIVPTAAWGAFLTYLGWSRRQHARFGTPLKRSLAESWPVVALLVCLIATAIEWEFVAKRQGHSLVALSWTVGVAAVIALARRNRRATVVTALRAFLGLLVIGALAQWSLSGLIAVGVTAAVLLMLEKLWPKPPKFSLGASEQEEAAISREPSSYRFR